MPQKIPKRNRVNPNNLEFDEWRVVLGLMKPTEEEQQRYTMAQGKKCVSLKLKIQVPTDFIDNPLTEKFEENKSILVVPRLNNQSTDIDSNRSIQEITTPLTLASSPYFALGANSVLASPDFQ
jgi:hypothetical protein